MMIGGLMVCLPKLTELKVGSEQACPYCQRKSEDDKRRGAGRGKEGGLSDEIYRHENIPLAWRMGEGVGQSIFINIISISLNCMK
jgi:hypothetical protein